MPINVEKSSCSLVSLEHVVLRMSLDIDVQGSQIYTIDDDNTDTDVLLHRGPRRGAIRITLFSPNGTK